jgi:hypothetical protein
MADREKAVKGLECCVKGDACISDCPYYKEEPMTDGRCITVMQADVLAILKEQQWHLLTEDSDGIVHGLPGDDGQYLMTDGKDTWIDFYVDGVADGIILDSGRDIREIMAWMYMPELPKIDRR